MFRPYVISFLVLAAIFAVAGAEASPVRILEYIPGGTLLRGDLSPGDPGEGFADERPVHEVPLTGFFVENLEVTWSLWNEVRSWAATNGYPDLPEGQAGAGAVVSSNDHPVVMGSWHDTARWCNARSEMEALEPVYHLDAAFAEVYRTGTVDLARSGVRPDASGYRLPTEAEWEWAASGGLEGQVYPWAGSGGSFTDHIAPHLACYATNATTAVGSYASNGYRLFDLAGNAAEWCWDWFGPDYYATWYPAAWPADPAGPDQAPLTHVRVVRGGAWNLGAFDARCAFRDHARPDDRFDALGFRVVRGLEGNLDLDRDTDGLPDWWEYTHFGYATNAAPATDSDGDLLSEREEYLLGSDPHDDTSGFNVSIATAPAGPGWELAWFSLSNYTYDVHRATNDVAALSLHEADLPATPPVNVYTDSPPAAETPVFYRVRMQRPEEEP